MDAYRSEACVPADHPCLAGHFPGRPIVPGVLLLELVQETLGRHRGALRLARIRQVKFLAPLEPGTRFSIALEVDGAGAGFRCESGGLLLAQGSLEFQAA
jgi:3-hydroxymyristoyl/3-hydroxydecanoyl-(acyl carrier protein) dehydratase